MRDYQSGTIIHSQLGMYAPEQLSLTDSTFFLQIWKAALV